jgi:acetylornithine/N-succinyldiaminopimelate aminotransferase
MQTYHRLPVTFTRGEGVWLFDEAGRRWLDFCSGIAVNVLGHAHPALTRAIAEQAARLCHVCNYYQSDVSEAFAEKLIAACAGAGMRKLFFCNSGAEANEGAIKIARKYSLSRHGSGRHRIVTLKNGFHGRTITTLSATGQDVFHKDFGPFTEGFEYVEPEDLAALDRALDPALCAGFLAEAVQGESGVRPLSEGYVREAARLCAERDILLLFDEVQAGIGRTGTFLACEGYGVKADVVTLAKGLAGGVPVGAVLAGAKAADVLGPGDHGSTFGGNPLAAAAGLVVLDTVARPAFLAEVRCKGDAVLAALRGWNHPKVKEVRGRGLMAGIDISEDARPVLERALGLARGEAPGLLILSAGQKTLRLLPPLVISGAELEQGLALLKGCL